MRLRPARLFNAQTARAGSLALAATALVSGLLAIPAEPTRADTDTSGDPGTTAVMASPGSSSDWTRSQPNIVVVMADDMRVDDLRFAPNVRSLIQADGVTFENAFSSYPLCCPARASFLSGMLPRNHKVWTTSAPYGYGAFDDTSTIATALHDAGYSTGLTGKYLNNYGAVTSSADGGTYIPDNTQSTAERTAAIDGRFATRVPIPDGARIDSWRKVPAGWDDFRGGIDIPTDLARTGLTGGTYNYFDFAENINGVAVNFPGQYSTDVIGSQSVDMIHEFTTGPAASKPFFLYAAFVGPHCGRGDAAETARDAREGFRTQAGEGGNCTPAAPASLHGIFNRTIKRGAGVLRNGMTEADANHDGRDTAADTADKPHTFGTMPAFSRKRLIQERDNTRQRAEAVYAVDQQVGNIISTLKATGAWDNTEIVFTSDNGAFEGEHHHFQGKVLGYEPVLRIPIVITGPGLRGHGAQKRYDPIDMVDLSRTVTDWGNATPPHVADGVSKVEDMLGAGDQGWHTAVPIEQAQIDPVRGGFAAVMAHRVHTDPAFRLTAADPRMSIGLRTGRYSYVRYADGSAELYDLWRDPLEMSNVATAKRYRAIRRELDSVWRQNKDCAGLSCQAPLPANLQLSAAQNAAHTEAFWNAYAKAYGHPTGA